MIIDSVIHSKDLSNENNVHYCGPNLVIVLTSDPFYIVIKHMLHTLIFFQKNGIDYLKYEDPDIFCLQETKCSESKLPPEVKMDGYHTYWLSGTAFKLYSINNFHCSMELYYTKHSIMVKM